MVEHYGFLEAVLADGPEANRAIRAKVVEPLGRIRPKLEEILRQAGAAE